MKTGIFGIFILLLLAGSGCEKIQSYPPEPKLTYKSHQVKIFIDELGNKDRILFSCTYDFVDGDGDLITEPDTIEDKTAAYSKQYTLFFKKKDGIYLPLPNPSIEIILDTVITVLPYGDFMKRDGQNKTLRGTITYNHKFVELDNYSDTVKIDIYVIDKALHKSNVLEFPDIVLK